MTFKKKETYFSPATNWSQELKLATFICSGGDNTGDPDAPPPSPARRIPLQ